MRFRSLALFALTTCLTILAGGLTPVEAQLPKQAKKLKKNATAPLPPTPPAAEPTPPPAPPKPLPTVIPAPTTKDAAALARLIDAEIDKKLAEAKIPASPGCTDEEFLRRAYLDITGVIPTPEKAKAFLDDPTPDKRARLLDDLLADPNYGRRMADIWTAKLFPRDSANRFVQREPFYKWFESEFNANTPWNVLVSKLVTAEGDVESNPAVTYFLANRSIDKLTDTASQHFLGIQLQCAQCHNHPFTNWKQTEYWAMAAFFSKVRTDNPKNPNKGSDNGKIGVTEGNGPTRQRDFLPESAQVVPAKFLGGEQPRLIPTQPYRPVLAKWMTAPENPFFARALVNRTWAHLFGRGIVHPVDDMLPENEPSHPELLDALARHIGTAGEFDLKYLIKAICLSQTYQRTSKIVPGNQSDVQLFSHMSMKVMSPEQLFDSLAQVTGLGKGQREPKGPKVAPKGTPAGARDQFVTFFLAGAETPSAISYEAGIPQALRLMNSPITNHPAAVRAITAGVTKPDEAIERIYLATLSRRPSAEEKTVLLEHVAKSASATAGYSDILWAVLNSSEFTLVR
jgi:hypothetical protein